MASYVVTGASRGIGFEFIRQLSADPKNTVFALVRDKAAAEKQIAAEIGASNITVLQADITDVDAVKAAADTVSKATNGKLDYLIANAGKISYWSGMDDVEDLASADPKDLEKDLLDLFHVNVIGNVHLFNAFLPLIRNGSAKKVIAISSAMSDAALSKDLKLTLGFPYAVSKGGLNTLVAKYQAQYIDEGILFLAVCPGAVATSQPDSPPSEKQIGKVMAMFGAFNKYQPKFTGPVPPPEAVADVLKVIYNATVEKDGGKFVSHTGNEKWL